jgi:hypothetical protein
MWSTFGAPILWHGGGSGHLDSLLGMAKSRAPFLSAIALKRDKVPSFGEYPFSIPAIRNLRELALPGHVTFFVGENGTGKSTLLEALAVACGFNAEGGSRNFRFSTRPSHSGLHEYLRLVRPPGRPRDGYFLRAESFYNVATCRRDSVRGARCVWRALPSRAVPWRVVHGARSASPEGTRRIPWCNDLPPDEECDRPCSLYGD